MQIYFSRQGGKWTGSGLGLGLKKGRPNERYLIDLVSLIYNSDRRKGKEGINLSYWGIRTSKVYKSLNVENTENGGVNSEIWKLGLVSKYLNP